MVSTINATSSGVATTADNSGILKVQSNGVTVSALAWVNFDGTLSGTISPRASYNISSITKNTTGDYTLTFTNALADANYAPIGICSTANAYPSYSGSRVPYVSAPAGTISTTQLRVATGAGATSSGTGGAADAAYVTIAIFGNS